MWFTVSRFSYTMSMAPTLMWKVSSRNEISVRQVHRVEQLVAEQRRVGRDLDTVGQIVGLVAQELQDLVGIGSCGRSPLLRLDGQDGEGQGRVPLEYEKDMGLSNPRASMPARTTFATVYTRWAVWNPCSRPHSSVRMWPRAPAQP